MNSKNKALIIPLFKFPVAFDMRLFLTLLTASVIGYLRYEAGEHFPTDILAGAVVGSTIGYVIPWMHHIGKENVSITPRVPHGDSGFSVQIKF